MRIILIGLTLWVLAVIGHAATIKIPGDFPSIQQAINAAGAGDLILVGPGTYHENIDFLGKDVVLRSEQGPATTIIDGNQQGSVVTFKLGETQNTVLDGFTITNGSGDLGSSWWVYVGGGIHIDYDSNPLITNNIITDNRVDASSTGMGGGVYMGNSSPRLHNNVIQNNHAGESAGGILMEYSSAELTHNIIKNNAAKGSGGLLICYQCHPIVENNEIIGNQADTYGAGGVHVYYQCSGVIKNNVIRQNSALCGGGFYCGENNNLIFSNNTVEENHSASFGGGIYCFDDSVLIADNRIVNNTAPLGGGGCYLGLFKTGYEPILQNNLIDNNSVSTYGGGGIFFHGVQGASSAAYLNNVISNNTSGNLGGGVLCSEYASSHFISNTIYKNQANAGGGAFAFENKASSTIKNCILWNNTSISAGKGTAIYLMNNSKLTISHCNISGGKSSVKISPNANLYWGAGMIDSDPLFVDEMGMDFHLQHHSPCRDSGDNNAFMLPMKDFEGDPRIAGLTDMGADEFYTHLYCMGDTSPNSMIRLNLVGTPALNPTILWFGSGFSPQPLPLSAGDWFLGFPILYEFFLGAMPSPGGVLTLQGQIPGALAPPYSFYMQALIGNKLTNPWEIAVN